MQGRRLPDDEWLSRAADGLIEEPGDYGRCSVAPGAGSGVGAIQWDWFVCCPDGSIARLWVNEDDRNGSRHVVNSHDDGSITVGGSIRGGRAVPVVALVAPDPEGGYWHGYLERGVWTSC